ncbi:MULTISPECIES: glycosyltransferase [Gordonia]|uniref:Glycosyltransferase n=1 Tax=Gordonia tangerina TaxID=2911060 RepID=A0ABS9DLM7_9ACTN|nr:glycosyltransferase [Gordonia tangerina]MCF3940145.1 glycosyltransferase [Gordonia tangerina]
MTADHRIRVLYVVPDLGIGGAERHVTTLMPALDPDRFDPAVICIGDEGALFSSLARARVPALALHRTKRQAPAALRDLIREFRRFDPDVVITRGYSAEGLGRIAAFLTRVPVSIVWVHNCGETEPLGRLRRLLDTVLDKATTAYFGVARAQLPYLVDERGYAPAKVTIIHNGVDPSEFDPRDDRSALADAGVGEDHPVVGIVAAMRPEKDHTLFLEAASKVLQTLPDARFALVGDGPLRSDLERRARELGIDEAVVFTGPRSDIPEVMRAIDVLVLCSYTVECFPMALLEAMAAGRPAVCTDVGGVGEMVVPGHTGYLIAPHDPAALAERLITLMSDADLRREMGSSARRRVEDEFSLSASIAGTQSAITELVPSETSTPTSPLVLTVVLDLTYVGGVEKLLLNLFRSFDDAVVVPRIVCLREAGPLADDFRAHGFEVTELDSTHRRRGRRDPRRIADLVADLRRSQTDVVLVPHHHRAALLIGRLAARVARVPNIVAAHDMDLTSVGGRVLPRATVSTLWLSDALVLLTRAQGDYLHREEGVGRTIASTTREIVIPNGIPIGEAPGAQARLRARERLGLSPDDFAIGIVARLSPQKAHEVLFTAVASLATDHPNTCLLVIGGGQRESELRSLAADLGIDEQVAFIGVRDDVPDILPGLDVSCLSSVHEGVPIIMIESMAAGLPVVATDCGSLRDLITDDDNGYLVPVSDAEAMAARLTRLADDPDLRARLGANGRRRARTEFPIAATARDYERLLAELTNRKVR